VLSFDENTPIDIGIQVRDRASFYVTISTVTDITILSVLDTDNDGLNDAKELELGTNPNKRDTDGDGFSDADEVFVLKSDPLNPSDPLVFDFDGDGIISILDVLRFDDPPKFDDTLFNFINRPVGTTGTIIDPAGLDPRVNELLNPAGVNIKILDPLGTGKTSTIEACTPPSILLMPGGTEADVTCKSVIINVITGPIIVNFVGTDGTVGTTTLETGVNVKFDPETFTLESIAGTAQVTLTGSDGTTAQVRLPENNSITFDSQTSTITTDPANPDPIPVVIDGEETTIDAGETVVVVDSTPPEITATLEAIDVEEDEGLFRVVFSVTDNLDSNPIVSADINGIAVENGQIVELEIDDETESEFDDGVLEMEAPSFTLTVTATDNAGNSSTETVEPEFVQEDDDEEEDDDEDEDEDD